MKQKGVYFKLAKRKSTKSESTTLSFIDKLASLPVPSTEVEFQGERFTILHNIPINTVNLISRLVIANTFTYDEENTMTFNPLATDIIWDYCKVRYFTNIPLSEDIEAGEIYDLAHRTGLMSLINSTIPRDTQSFIEGKLYKAIEAKKYMISQENNVLNILQTIIKNIPTPEAIATMSEQVKGMDFSQLKILTPEK